MDTVLKWLGTYSPGVVVLLLFFTIVLWLAKLAAEKAVADEFQKHAKEVELALTRRSAFLDKVLTDRWAVMTRLIEALARILTNLYRIRNGQAPPSGFLEPRTNEVIPLTTVYEDLEIHRMMVGEALHGVLRRRAELVLEFARLPTQEDTAPIEEKLEENAIELRGVVTQAFPLKDAKFDESGKLVT